MGAGKSTNRPPQPSDRYHGSPLLIHGATDRINGKYTAIGTECNGQVLYQRDGDDDTWLRCCPDGNWLVSSTYDKDKNTNGGFMHSQETNVSSPLDVKSWLLFNGKEFIPDKGVEILPFPTPLLVSGVVGSHSNRVNGKYVPHSTLYNKRSLFQKEDDHDVWLRYYYFGSCEGFWIISDTEHKDKGDGGGWLSCREKGSWLPTECNVWNYFDGQKSEEERGVFVTPYPPNIRIGGVDGPNGERLNGTYIPTLTFQNGQCLFQKNGDRDTWLRFCPPPYSNWVVSSTEDKDENGEKGWMYSVDRSVESPLDVKKWRVHDGTDFKDADNACVVINPTPVLIGGVEGRDAARISGKYVPTDNVYNGRFLYQKEGDHDVWLRYGSGYGKHWIVSSTEEKDKNSESGMMYCREKGTQLPTESKCWFVYDGSVYRAYYDVAVLPWSVGVVIGGVVGPNSDVINGSYLPVSQVYNGRHLYIKAGSDDIWLRYSHKLSSWVISTTKEKDEDAASGFMYCKEKYCRTPTEGKTWLVHAEGVFKEDESVVIFPLPE
jgi:hypothetical protein